MGGTVDMCGNDVIVTPPALGGVAAQRRGGGGQSSTCRLASGMDARPLRGFTTVDKSSESWIEGKREGRLNFKLRVVRD